MTDRYAIPARELPARLRAYEGEIWETTMCFNGLREAAAARIEELEVRLARVEAYGKAAE